MRRATLYALGVGLWVFAFTLLVRDSALMKKVGHQKPGLSIITFRAAAVDSPIGALLVPTIAGLTVVTTALYAIEAGRAGARGLLTLFSVWAVLYQSFGIGFVDLAGWLPAFLCQRHLGTRVSPRRVAVASIGAALFLLDSLILTEWPTDSKMFMAAALALQGIGALDLFMPGDLFSPVEKEKQEPPDAGNTAAAQLFRFLTGATATTYWAHAASGLKTRGIAASSSPSRAIADAVSRHGAAAFISLDLFALYLGALLFVALEGAFPQTKRNVAVVLATFVRRSFVCGPGAAFAATLAEREVLMGREAVTAAEAARLGGGGASTHAT